MNREIKFQGKRVDNREWIYGSLIEDKYIVGKVVDWEEDYFNTEFWWKVIPETVGQFTGRTDDGGDDLYDGDIISFDYELESYIGVIKWFAETYEFVVKPNGWSISLSLYEIDDAVTKLGNIHDNPEILEITQNN